jgi:hypothetical protein
MLALQLDNLVRFNGQFSPGWEPRYLVVERRGDLPRAAVAAMAAEGYLPHAGLVRGTEWPPPEGGADDGRPAGAGKPPGERPAATHGQPPAATHGQPPAARGQPPAARGQPPAATHGQPPAATHGQPPAAHGQPPAATHGQPPAATRLVLSPARPRRR